MVQSNFAYSLKCELEPLTESILCVTRALSENIGNKMDTLNQKLKHSLTLQAAS